MKSAISISWRAALACVLMLAVLFVPLAHSAHFHEGGSDGDASLSATCVICQAAGGYMAEAARSADLSMALHDDSVPGVEPAALVRAAFLTARTSRAPPSSLS